MAAPADRAGTDAEISAEELRQKKRLLAQLVVHDLRSPLSAVSGYLELLREELRAAGTGAPDAARVGSYLDDCGTLLDKALGLVSTILDVDELEDGILRARPTRFRVLETVEPARATSRAAFQMRQLRFECAIPPGFEIELDHDMFARVLENLIDNSARYAPRGGRVVVTAENVDGNLELMVANDGKAVPESERKTIFGRYYQVEARRASARANRGLGLYFCRLVAEAHGGSIAVEERGELHAAFVLRVPQPPRVEE